MRNDDMRSKIRLWVSAAPAALRHVSPVDPVLPGLGLPLASWASGLCRVVDR